jgi:hypothetical protein
MIENSLSYNEEEKQNNCSSVRQVSEAVMKYVMSGDMDIYPEFYPSAPLAPLPHAGESWKVNFRKPNQGQSFKTSSLTHC